MSEYKYPISRKKVYDKLASSFEDILSGAVGKDDSVESTFNRGLDDISGNYNDYIESGEYKKKEVKEKCHEEFVEMLQEIRNEIIEALESEMEDLFNLE